MAWKALATVLCVTIAYVSANPWKAFKPVPWQVCPRDPQLVQFNVTKPGPFGSVAQMELIHQLRDLSFDVADALDRHGICYWLDSGTLLGLVRHGAIIPYDGDADFGILEDDYNNTLNALAELDSKYQVQTWESESDPTQKHIRVVINEARLDIYCYRYYSKTDQIKHPWAMKGSKDDFFPLARAKFYRKKLWIPRNPHNLLVELYGDYYMVPDRSFDWETLSYESSPSQDEFPLVSLIIPTYERPHFLVKALELIRRQDYPNLEVIIVDDSEVALQPQQLKTLLHNSNDYYDDWVHYYYIEDGRKSIGQKRNIACEHAKGAIVMQWDDDDFYREHRITHQVAPIINGDADFTAVEHHYYLVLKSKRFYTVERLLNWGPHFGTITLKRELWEATKYTDNSLAEDYGIAEKAILSGAKLQVIPNLDGKHVYIRHSNTWEFDLESPSEQFRVQAVEKPSFFPQRDLDFYVGIKTDNKVLSSKPPNYFPDPSIRWDLPELQPPRQANPPHYPNYLDMLQYPHYLTNMLQYPQYSNFKYPHYGNASDEEKSEHGEVVLIGTLVMLGLIMLYIFKSK